MAYDAQQQQQQSRWDPHTPSPTPLIKTEPIEANWLESSRSGTGKPYNKTINRSTNSQHNSNRNQPSTSSRFNGNCNFCQKFGHKATECRTRIREQNNNNFRSEAHNGARPYYNNPRSYDGNRNDDNRQLSNSRLKTNQANSHTIGVQNSTNSTSDEFPFFITESSTVELSSIIQSSTPLLKSTVKLVLFNQEPQMVSALLDGGTSHSFISSNILTKAQLQIAADKITVCLRDIILL
jgi:hypothetical protein